MSDVMEQHDLYVSSFRAQEREFAARDPQWLLRLRQEAIESFARLGFPTVHDEEWRFTNVAPLAKVLFQAAPDETDTWEAKGLEGALPGGSSAESGAIRLVFVNGFTASGFRRLGVCPEASRRGILRGCSRKRMKTKTERRRPIWRATRTTACIHSWR